MLTLRGAQTSAKTIHVFQSSKDLNKVTKIKDYFDNLTTEYFTDFTTDNNRDMTVAVITLAKIWTQKT